MFTRFVRPAPAALLLTGILACPCGFADVNLEWRPVNSTALALDTFDVGLYAVSDDSEIDRSISAMYAILVWDPFYVRFMSNVDNGPYTWFASGFHDDSTLDDLNHRDGNMELTNDGDAIYVALGQFGNPAIVDSDGLLITSMRFRAIRETPSTPLTIPEHIEQYSYTVIYDGFVPGLDVTGTLGSAAVTVLCNPCDTNCDGSINLFDIDPFVSILISGGGCATCAADANFDGSVNLFDIDPFVVCLTGS